eukprot:SAG11_NODE_4811_length_1758_cov_1.572634_1_plen_89_part_00
MNIEDIKYIGDMFRHGLLRSPWFRERPRATTKTNNATSLCVVPLPGTARIHRHIYREGCGYTERVVQKFFVLGRHLKVKGDSEHEEFG